MKEGILYDSLTPDGLAEIPDSQYEQWIINQQEASLKQRAPGKYDVILAVVGVNPVLRILYHAGRAIDDVADGDTPVPAGYEDFGEWIGHLEAQVNSGFTKCRREDRIEFLLMRAFSRLQLVRSPDDDIKREFIDFLDAMGVEQRRHVNHGVLTKDDLAELYTNSFGLPQSVALIAIGSPTRAGDIPELQQLLGRFYALRDLKKDLANGICNIPQEVLDGGELSFEELRQNPNMVDTNDVVQVWIRDEVVISRRLLEQLNSKKLDWRACILVTFLTLGVKRDIFQHYREIVGDEQNK